MREYRNGWYFKTGKGGVLLGVLMREGNVIKVIDESEIERILNDYERLQEFYEAHCELEKGTLDFDLHHKTVERFRRAQEALTGGEDV